MKNIVRNVCVIILTISAIVLADVNSAPKKTTDTNTTVKQAEDVSRSTNISNRPSDETVRMQYENAQLKIENAVMEKTVKAHEDSVTHLTWALGIVILFVGYIAFKSTREYKEARDEAKEAAKDAKETAKEAEKATERAMEWERKAQETFQKIDTAVKQKLDEIEKRSSKMFGNKAKEVIEQIKNKAEAERKKSQDEAEKQRQASDLQVKSLHEMYSAITILDQALKKEGVEADKLFAESYEKFQKAIEIKPDSSEVFKYWGGAYLWQAQKKEGEEKKKLLYEAKDKSLRAEQTKKGSGAYNLACIAAIEGNEPECKKWLKIGEEAGTLMTREWAMEDVDLKAYWNEEWFKAIKWKEEK